jgi:histidinol-phosphate aminotransferase
MSDTIPAPHVIDLWRNENHYGPAPACFDVLRNVTSAQLHDYARTSPLTDGLAEILGVDRARISLGQGAEDLLTQALQLSVEPGDRVLIPSASWWYYRILVARVLGLAIEYPVRELGDEWVTDVDELLAEHRANPARVILLTTVSNPTGATFPIEDIPRVCEACPDAIVIVDDAYWGFGDDADPATLARLTDEHPNLILLRTFSKLYALAGARIGYAVTGDDTAALAKHLARSLGHNRLSEALGIAALGSPEYYAMVRKAIVEDRDRFAAAVGRYPGVTAYRSAANFQLVRFPASTAARVRDALTGAGLVVKWLDEPDFVDCARITIGTTAEHDYVRQVVMGGLGELPGRARVNSRADFLAAYARAGGSEPIG